MTPFPITIKFDSDAGPTRGPAFGRYEINLLPFVSPEPCIVCDPVPLVPMTKTGAQFTTLIRAMDRLDEALTENGRPRDHLALTISTSTAETIHQLKGEFPVKEKRMNFFVELVHDWAKQFVKVEYVWQPRFVS